MKLLDHTNWVFCIRTHFHFPCVYLFLKKEKGKLSPTLQYLIRISNKPFKVFLLSILKSKPKKINSNSLSKMQKKKKILSCYTKRATIYSLALSPILSISLSLSLLHFFELLHQESYCLFSSSLLHTQYFSLPLSSSLSNRALSKRNIVSLKTHKKQLQHLSHLLLQPLFTAQYHKTQHHLIEFNSTKPSHNQDQWRRDRSMLDQSQQWTISHFSKSSFSLQLKIWVFFFFFFF